MTNQFLALLISLGGVSGVIGGANWHVSHGETTIAVVLAIVGVGLLAARRELEPNGRLHAHL
jgi:hypothetical protein